MPIFLDTRGRSKVAIGICARCSCKFPYDELVPDPNYPGLYVCEDDRDQFDPYRLPAHETEDITLDHARPDVDISSPGPSPIFVPPVMGVAQAGFATTWQPNTPYAKGATVTPQNINAETVTLPQPWLMCIAAGTSGSSAPPSTLRDGVEFVDGGVTWYCLGIYPN